jgi:hypothetical protein
VAGAYVATHKPAPQVAKQAPATSVSPAVPATATVANPSPVAPASAAAAPPVQMARKSAPLTVVEPAANSAAESASATADDQQFLREVSTRAPSMRATYENQLQAVNSDIRETQEYVDRNPGDADARQHLMDAYEQKALLYQIALDHIQ